MDKAIYFAYGRAILECMETIGQRISRLRNALGMGQEDLAAAIGVNQSMISEYENDKAMFSAAILVSLAEALETTMDNVMYGDSRVDAMEAGLVGAFRAMQPKHREITYESARAFAAIKPKAVPATKKLPANKSA